MMHVLLLLTALSLLPVAGPVQWSFVAEPAGDGLVSVELTATVEEGWHIYATRLENDLGPIPTAVRFDTNDALVPVGVLAEPEPEEVFDPNFDMQVRYHSGTPVFTQRFKVLAKGAGTVKGEVEFMVCNDKTCLPPEVVKFEIPVEAAQSK